MNSSEGVEPNKLAVFISYASEDLAHAANIENVLRSEGFEPWLDKEKLLPGQDQNIDIEKAIEKSDAIVICLSKQSINKRGYVQNEITKALDEAKKQPEGVIFLITARLEPCDVPHRLRKKHWADIFEPNGIDYLIASLKTKAKDIGYPVTPEGVSDYLAGIYLASGINENGSKYYGKTIILAQGYKYLITWYVADDQFDAIGIRDKDRLAVTGYFNSFYQICPNGDLHGEGKKVLLII